MGETMKSTNVDEEIDETEEETEFETEEETEFETEEEVSKERPSKKNKNSSFMIVMIGGLVILLGGGVYFIKTKIDELAKPTEPTKIESNATVTKTEAPLPQKVLSKEKQQEKIKEIIAKTKIETAQPMRIEPLDKVEGNEDIFVLSDELIEKSQTEKQQDKKTEQAKQKPLPAKKKKEAYYIPPTPEEIANEKAKKAKEELKAKNKKIESASIERDDATEASLEKEKRRSISELPLPSEMKIKETRQIEDQAFGLEAIEEEMTIKNGGVCRSSKDALLAKKEYVYYVRDNGGYIPVFESENWDGVGVKLDERIVSLSSDEENGLVEVEENKFLPIELFSSCSVFSK